jgi:collagenase-like PrtC family protease
MLSTGIAGLRIEAQLDSPATVATITATYRRAVDSLMAGEIPDIAAGLEAINDATCRPQSDGPFDFQAVPAETKEHDLVTSRTNRA